MLKLLSLLHVIVVVVVGIFVADVFASESKQKEIFYKIAVKL